jgi:putative redox protein
LKKNAEMSTIIKLKRIDKDYLFEAHNENGNEILIDADPSIGGHNAGMRPMQLLLAGIGSCSVFDMILLLKKQRQPIEDIEIEVVGERSKGVPAPWETITMTFVFYGNLKEEKVAKAVQQGVEKYCSVGLMLEKMAKINYSYRIVRPA